MDVVNHEFVGLVHQDLQKVSFEIEFLYEKQTNKIQFTTYTASHLCRKSIVRQICFNARSIRSFQIGSTMLLVLTAPVVILFSNQAGFIIFFLNLFPIK